MTNGIDDKILERLAKLKAHAESAEKIGSLEEAEAFASMLNRLLLKHKLELTDIEVEREEQAEPVEWYPIDYTKYPDIQIKKVRIEWIERLASIIAKAHFCRMIVSHDSSRLSLAGRRSDVEVAEFMIITMQRTASKLAQKEHSKYAWECYKADRSTARARGFKRAFITSFITRISERFEAERAAAAGGSSTALVRFDRATAAVNDFIKNSGNFKMTRGLTRQSASHAEGMARGRAAADSINLRTNAIKSSTVKPVGYLS